MRHSVKIGVLGTIFSVLMAGTAIPEEQEKAALAALGNFGVSFTTSVYQMYSAGTAPSVVPANADDATRELGQLVDKYKRDMKTTAASANLAKASGELVINTAIIGGTASGVGAVPTAIVGSLAYWGNSAFAEHLREEGEKQARGILVDGVKNWDQKKSGLSYDQVREMYNNGKHKEAAELFDKATGALTFMKSELKDDPGAADAAEGVLLKIFSNNAKATILEMGELKSSVSDFAKQMKASRKIVEATAEKLDEVAGRLKTVEGDLQDGLDSLQRISQSNETQINIIGDVLFGQQSTEVKILMLQKGAKPDLDPSARADLIKVLEVQKSKEDFIRDSGEIVSNLQGIDSIMTSLGIGNKDISKAISYASVAQTAVSQALSGNYIGAIAGALGVFGGNKPSAEEQLLRQVMGFLQEMDKKLNVIIELQQKTLAAIEGLSKQLAGVEKRLNERLDMIEAITKTTSDNLKKLMWLEYADCQVAYESRGDGYNESNESFKSAKDLYKFMKERSKDAITCARDLEHLFVTIKDEKIFGNPLSLSTAARTDFSITPEETEDRVYKREALDDFLKNVYKPTYSTVFVNSWKKEWGHSANAIALLASPSATTTGVRARQAELDKNANLSACSADTLLSWRLRSLFCATTIFAATPAPGGVAANAEQLALERVKPLMRDPIVRDQLPRLIQWAAFSARPYDLWAGGEQGSYYSIDELASKGHPRGRELIFRTMQVVDLGIAQQAMLHGDLTAKFIYDAIWDKDKNQPTVDLGTDAGKIFANKENPWLEQNVLMFAMEDSLKPELADADITISYQRALEPFFDTKLSPEDQKRIGHTFLKSIFNFPDTVTYTQKEEHNKKAVYITFPGCPEIRLPDPETFQKRALLYPESVYELLRSRDMLAERFVDYELLKDIDKTDGGKVAMSVLLHGTNQP